MSKKEIIISYILVGLVSVTTFFAWGWLEKSFAHSWIILIVGAMGCLLIQAYNPVEAEMQERENISEEDVQQELDRVRQLAESIEAKIDRTKQIAEKMQKEIHNKA